LRVAQVEEGSVACRLERADVAGKSVLLLADSIAMPSVQPGQVDGDHRAVGVVDRRSRLVPVVRADHDARHPGLCSCGIQGGLASLDSESCGGNFGSALRGVLAGRLSELELSRADFAGRTQRGVYWTCHQRIQQRLAALQLLGQIRDIAVEA